jgi:hypothetical protein
MVRRSIAVAFGTICIILAVGLVGVISSLQNQLNDLANTLNLGKSLVSLGNQTSLTIWAWSDASYSFGSSKWMFLYEPSFGSSHEAYLSFPFPFFSINPSQAERISGQPILISALSTVGLSEIEGRYLNATAGASYIWDGMEITVPIANTYYVVLAFKPLS